jgi:hypothetical protein
MICVLHFLCSSVAEHHDGVNILLTNITVQVSAAL